MATQSLIDWQAWHTTVIERMEAILRKDGKSDTYDYEDLRVAEVRAIVELRRERANTLRAMHAGKDVQS